MVGYIRRAAVLSAALACMALGLPTLGLGRAPAVAAREAQVAAGRIPLVAASAASASALASSSGQPVEILPDRTDWAQVFAEPGGGFLAQESAAPVRVQQSDGSWVPVNTTLSTRADRSVAPGATVPGLVLSGGGSGPLFTVSQPTGGPAGSVSVSWPFGSLPAPSLSGATATYANVLPGVNLLVTAQPTGVDAVLQVTSAAAAADPRLANISFPLSAPGLGVALDGRGGVTMKGTAGDALFTEPPAEMWDSAGMGGAASSDASTALPPGLGGPVPGDHVGVARVSVGVGSVSLSPVASVMSGPSVVYPVYIDPQISYSNNQTGWLDVGHDFNGYNSSNNGGPCKSQGGSWNCWGNWDYEDPLGGVRAGVWCNGPSNPPAPPPPSNICFDSYPDSTWGVYRSYLNFSLPSALAGAAKDSVDAQLSVYNLWSYNCTNGSSLELWETGEATSSMAYNSRPSETAWQDSSTKSYGNTCNPHGISLNATSAVTDQMNAGEVTLELRASLSSENARPPDLTNWRRFQATGTTCGFPGASTPCLQVFWMHKPDQGTALGPHSTFNVQNGQTVTDCATGQASPDYVNTTTPRLDGSVTDPDVTSSNNPLTTWIGKFGWNDVTSGASGSGTFGTGNVDTSTNTFWDKPPSGTFVDGHEYQVQAYGEAQAKDTITGNTVTEDGTRSSPCYVTVDTTPPVGVPSIAPVHGTTWTVGKPGQVMISDPKYGQSSDSDVVGYFYGVGSSQPTQYVQASNGTATVTIKPYTMATESVYAEAVDPAGNIGPVNSTSPYTFTASAGPGNVSTMGYWPLNNTTADPSGLGNQLTPASGASFPCASSTNPPGYKCTLSGEADTAAGVVSAEAAFTASVWASASGCMGTCVAMSEDATNHSVFTLAYQSSCSLGSYGCWAFSVWPSDLSGVSPVTVTAAATQAQQQGAWTQLDGVFDPGSLALTLYVNGPSRKTQQTGFAAWRTPETLSALRLGAGYKSAQAWPGNVSDACVFYGVLSDHLIGSQTQSDIQTLYAGNASTTDGCSAVQSEYP